MSGGRIGKGPRDLLKELKLGASGPTETEEQLEFLWRGVVASPVAHTLSRMDFSIVHANDAAINLWGYGDQSAFLDIAPERLWRDGEDALIALQDHAAGGKPVGNLVASRADGSLGTYSVMANMVCDEADRPIGILASYFDVTDAVARDRELEKSQERYSIAAKYGETTVWEATPERDEFITTGESILPPDDDQTQAGTDFFPRLDLFHPEDAAMMRDYVRTFVAGELEALRMEARVLDPDGSIRWMLIHVNVASVPGERPVRLIGTTRDITEQKEAEIALRRSENRLARAQETAGLGSWELDLKTQEVFLSAELARIHGFDAPPDKLPLQDLFEYVHPDDLEDVSRGLFGAFTDGGPYRGEYRIRSLSGDEKIVRGTGELEFDDAGKPVRMYGTTQDITEIRATERQLQQAQKMEAVGQLSAGVAHDFNNLLAIIVGNLEILGDKTKSDAELGNLVGEAQTAASRGADLTKRLLALSSLRAPNPQPTNIKRLIEECSELLRRTIGQMVEIELDQPVDLWAAHIDPAQLESAVLNLAINARDAMPDGGKLTIRTKNVVIEELAEQASSDARAGDFVCIEVQDTGYGMTADIIDRAIEPFFTTKAAGRGSGLGLSMVHGFVRQSGGDFHIESEPDAGTIVRLLLPRASSDAVEPIDAMHDSTAGHQVSRRVLVVEDDPHVLNIVVKQLEALGYAAESANTSDEAFGLLETGVLPFDCMLVDVVLGPGVDGLHMALRVREKFPDLKILCMSGYVDPAVLYHAEADGELPIIAKPFTKNRLRDRLDLLFAD